MKKAFLIIACIIGSYVSFGQFPNAAFQDNALTLREFKGAVHPALGFILPFLDTLNNPASAYNGAVVQNPIDSRPYYSDGVKWIPFLTGAAPTQIDFTYLAGKYITDFNTIGTLNTDSVIEANNLYFTNSRARAAISATNHIIYNSATGVISFGTINTDSVIEAGKLYFTNARARLAISATNHINYNSTTGVISFGTINTDSVIEASNLYFTSTRARLSISATNHINYNSSTGVISFGTINTDTVIEASNLYFTNARSRSAISATSPIGYNSATGIISADTAILATQFDITSKWNLLGNSGTTPANFLGTTDEKNLLFRTNNIQRLKLDSSGNLFLTNFTNVAHTRLFRIGIDDGDSTMIFNVSSSGATRSSLTLKPSTSGFTADGSGSGFGPLKIVSSYWDSIYQMGLYGYGMYFGANLFKFNIPSGSPLSIFSVEKNSISQFMVKGDGSVFIGDTTAKPGLKLNITSTSQGVLFPRMNTAQMRAIVSPLPGTWIYNTDSAAYCWNVRISPDTLWTKVNGGGGGGGGGGGSGTVTNVATGYGLLGGPISNTGTLSLDSAVAAAYFLRRKDSVKLDSGYTTLYRNSLNKLNTDSTNTITGYTTRYRNSLNLLRSDSTTSVGFTTIYKNSLNLLRSDSTASTGFTSLYRNSLNKLNTDSTDAITGYTTRYRNSLNLLRSDSTNTITGFTTRYLNSLNLLRSDSTNGITGFTTRYLNSLNKLNTDSTNAITGYTTKYQNSLKQSLLIGTGFVKSTAGVISYDNTTYLTAATVAGKVDSISRKSALSDTIQQWKGGVASFAFRDKGGGNVDSIKNISTTVQRVYYSSGNTSDNTFALDSIHHTGDVWGDGLLDIADSLGNITHDWQITGLFVTVGFAARFQNGFQTGTGGSSTANAYTSSGNGIMSIPSTTINLMPTGANVLGMGVRFAFAGNVTTTGVSASYGYANVDIGVSPFTAPSSGRVVFATSLLVNPVGSITNSSSIRVGIGANLLLSAPATSSSIDSSFSMYSYGKVAVNDTIFTSKTMGASYNGMGVINGASLQAALAGVGASVDVAEQTLSSTGLVWDGTAPTTSTNTYRWHRDGKMVTVWVHLQYAIAGATNTTVSFPFPTDLPAPVIPAGFGVNDALYLDEGYLSGSQAPNADRGRSYIMYGGGTTFSLKITNQVSGAITTGWLRMSYPIP